jgi:hypothetical protein
VRREVAHQLNWNIPGLVRRENNQTIESYSNLRSYFKNEKKKSIFFKKRSQIELSTGEENKSVNQELGKSRAG